MTFLGCAAIVGGLAAVGPILYANLPTRMTIGAIVPTVDYLADTRLKKLEAGKDAQSALAGTDAKVNRLIF